MYGAHAMRISLTWTSAVVFLSVEDVFGLVIVFYNV